MGIYLIPESELTYQQIEAVMRSLDLESHPKESLADEQRWTWATRDRRTAVDYVEDAQLKVAFLYVRGDDEGWLADRLRRVLPIWSREKLVGHAVDVLVEGEPAKVEVAAMQVAIEMVDFDLPSAGFLNACTKMAEPSARLAGVRAMRVVPLVEFRVDAERLSHDSDPAVAAAAKDLLERIVELHGP